MNKQYTKIQLKNYSKPECVKSFLKNSLTNFAYYRFPDFFAILQPFLSDCFTFCSSKTEMNSL